VSHDVDGRTDTKKERKLFLVFLKMSVTRCERSDKHNKDNIFIIFIFYIFFAILVIFKYFCFLELKKEKKINKKIIKQNKIIKKETI